jgi:hypothetical protein
MLTVYITYIVNVRGSIEHALDMSSEGMHVPYMHPTLPVCALPC